MITKKCLQCNKEFGVIPSKVATKKYCCKKCFNESKVGKKLSDEHKEKLKGKTPWNKGKQLPEYVKEKIAIALTGRKSNIGSFRKGFIPWNKGTKGTGVCKPNSGSFKKGEKNRLGKTNSTETRIKIGNGNRGKKQTEEAKQKIREYNLRTGKKPPIMLGADNYNWKGGKSFEIYPRDWNEILKISIRERDNYICQLCGLKQGDKTHHVHHIDYDKKNCNPNNLITLCVSCHVKTNANRKSWEEYFNKLMKNIWQL